MDRLFTPPRELNWCPMTHCARLKNRDCGPGRCSCPPFCRCAACKSRTARARRSQLEDLAVQFRAAAQPRLFHTPPTRSRA